MHPTADLTIFFYGRGAVWRVMPDGGFQIFAYVMEGPEEDCH
jgi:hypothetical protein